MIDKMGDLARQLEALPGTRTELTTFPSGAAMLDVWREGRLFVMAYTPTWKGFGVDEVLDGQGLLEKYDFFSEDYAPAAEHLRKLVQNAQPASAKNPNSGGENGLPAGNQQIEEKPTVP